MELQLIFPLHRWKAAKPKRAVAESISAGVLLILVNEVTQAFTDMDSDCHRSEWK